MRRHVNAHSGRRDDAGDGERHMSPAARAAMERASGRSNADGAPRPSALRRFRRKVRSVYYRAVHSAVISGDPASQRDKADAIFRRSLLGVGCLCLLGVYVPLMLLRLFSLSDAPLQSMAELEKLKHRSFLHGVFYFGQTSDESPRSRSSKSFRGLGSLNEMQRKLLDDGKVNMEVERKRCERYNLRNTLSRRRRLFLGTIIADDPMETMEAIATESYNVFHTVSLIESNMTPGLAPRNWTHGLRSDNLWKAQRMFGPRTKVSVDYYVRELNYIGPRSTLHLDGNFQRWKMNGMGPEDVVVVAAPDETLSRDFLRALQICDFPELRRDRPCNESKILAKVATYEGSPSCLTKESKDVTSSHPTAILARCANQPRGENSKDRVYEREERFNTGYRFRAFGTTSWSDAVANRNASKCGDGSGNDPIYFLKDEAHQFVPW